MTYKIASPTGSCQVTVVRSNVRLTCGYTDTPCTVFTALHRMQTRSSDKKAVSPSVCLSNTCIVTKRKKNLSRFLYHAKDHLALFEM